MKGIEVDCASNRKELPIELVHYDGSRARREQAEIGDVLSVREPVRRDRLGTATSERVSNSRAGHGEFRLIHNHRAHRPSRIDTLICDYLALHYPSVLLVIDHLPEGSEVRGIKVGHRKLRLRIHSNDERLDFGEDGRIHLLKLLKRIFRAA